MIIEDFELKNNAEIITIVDADDNVIGSEPRQIARINGLINRIVRILIKNSDGQILIQQRAPHLLDYPSKWELSASGHVQAGEDYASAAARETREEIGLTTPLAYLGKYYLAEISDNLTLKRFNGVFLGLSDQTPELDPQEVSDARWVSPSELTEWIRLRPDNFTANARFALKKFIF